MRPTLNRVRGVAATGGIALLITGIVCFAAGARINTSRSIPLGLYWTTSDPVAKGSYVMFCPPIKPEFQVAKERGYIDVGQCPGSFGYMMKRVLAAKGDAISITKHGVRVNGSLLAISTPMQADGNDQPLPQLNIEGLTLATSDVLLMSDVSMTSFDARYFGPVNSSQIKTVIKPVLTW